MCMCVVECVSACLVKLGNMPVVCGGGGSLCVHVCV